MNLDDVIIGEKVRISTDLSKTGLAFQFDGQGKMKSMRGKNYTAQKVGSNSHGDFIMIEEYLFHPDDVEPTEETIKFLQEIRSKSFIFDPTNLFSGKPKCRKTKK
jgi:hypothetical protein